MLSDVVCMNDPSIPVTHSPLLLVHRDIVAILLDSGASPLVHDATVKRTPLHAACKTRKGREGRNGRCAKDGELYGYFVCFIELFMRWYVVTACRLQTTQLLWFNTGRQTVEFTQ